ncbi:unnamed protein product [Rhodiola kirilowii]
MGSLELIHCHIFVSILILISSFKPSSSQNHNLTDALNTYIHNYVNNKISSDPTKPRTGLIHNLTLPSNSNSSTIQVSVVRLRSGSLWARGQNISSFHIPPMIIPMPYVKRIVLLTSNLTTSSSHYFTPPQGYILVSPVVGLAVYNASATAFLGNETIDISLTGGPTTVTFDNVYNNAMCVAFGIDKSVSEFLNMTAPGVCSVFKQGYVGIVAPVSKQGSTRLSKRWLAGFLVGIVVVGMVSVIWVLVLVWRMVRRKRIREMEKQSEKDVTVGAIWVGESRLPAGNMCRTQPQLESEMFP